MSCVAEEPVRHKRGDVREDGKVFWAYAKSCVGGECWVTPEKFGDKLRQEKERAEKYRATGARREIQKRYDTSEKGRASQKKSRGNPKRKAYMAEYRERTREKTREYMRNYQRQRAASPEGRITGAVRRAAWRASKRAAQNKPSRSFELLGTDLEGFKNHIEAQFTEGMCWEKLGREIHLDHVVPLASANSPEELWKLCHYTNLQPLWAADNIRKGAKLPEQLSNN